MNGKANFEMSIFFVVDLIAVWEALVADMRNSYVPSFFFNIIPLFITETDTPPRKWFTETIKFYEKRVDAEEEACLADVVGNIGKLDNWPIDISKPILFFLFFYFYRTSNPDVQYANLIK